MAAYSLGKSSGRAGGLPRNRAPSGVAAAAPPRGTILSAILMDAVDFWVDRLNARALPAEKITRFGADRVAFAHPCGIPHTLGESDNDPRTPITNAAPEEVIADLEATRGNMGIEA